MNQLLLASLIATVASFGAIAQTTAPTPAPAPADANAPLPVANSFTESQARSRLEARGYTNISGLKKGDKGVWKGTATFARAQVNVSVDYRGNITRD